MEVVTASPNSNGVPPFHNHDVHEWSRIDSLTGVLERARLETDHWTANTIDSSHNYGKVVDTRARTNADGAIEQQARRQLEVFQSNVPGGRLQVIKSHTLSSSRRTSKSPTLSEQQENKQCFTNLELPLNPLDLSSQKSKATVGRSVGRRPPSRLRGRDESSINTRETFTSATSTDARSPATTNLNRISRLCNQIHENAVKQTFGKYYSRPGIHKRENGDGLESYEIQCANTVSLNGHSNLVRTKSTSSEDIHLISSEKDQQIKSVGDLQDLEQLQNWRRTSKIRRSLQFPTNQSKPNTRPNDLPVNTGSVRKIRDDLETGRRLNTALRGNNVDLDALDQILQSITSPKDSISIDKYEPPEKDVSLKKQKRYSFVTAESLQEVRGRLRRTNSSSDDVYKTSQSMKDEDADDGIDTEEVNAKQNEEMAVVDNQPSKVRSYIYGMETLMNKKPFLGTGSLESRTSRQVNGSSGSRSEDWYNRRKSYGFEQVHNHQDSINTIAKNKSLMDSSTDSGICRSSEIVLIPTISKSNCEMESGKEYYNRNGNFNNNSMMGNVKRYASIFEKKKDLKPIDNFVKGKPSIKDYESTKITIPIVSELIQENFNIKQLDFRNTSDVSLNNNSNDDEIKRHSIAVDESKYVNRTTRNNNFRRNSLAINDKSQQDSYVTDCLDDDLSQGRRHKKVEFCKTEVHFAVDSGRVNIVATDEKPPPTNNFRRRRRNSGTLYNNLLNEANKNELPVLHFGDTSYEKNMFTCLDSEDDPLLNSSHVTGKQSDLFGENTVTVSTNQSGENYGNLEDEKENVEYETPRGILKNKPIKPKPYLLGDDPFCTMEDKEIWGIRLKPILSSNDLPMWKSTVTLKNTLYDKHKEETFSYETPKFNLYKAAPSTREEPRTYVECHNNIRIISSQPLTKKSTWVTTDKIKETEDFHKLDIKGYSTKVNIGGGNITVIEDDLRDGIKQIVNKGLVVRIGRNDNNSHTIRSKTTMENDNTTTTTKITIDLSPSPTDNNEEPSFQPVRLPRASLSNFKSTSLVLNTFKKEMNVSDFQGNVKKSSIPQQLEALKRLYEDWHSDNEADKEVQLLMNKPGQELSKECDANSSVISGSWSKMKAFRNMQQQRAKNNVESCFNSHARLEKGLPNLPQDNVELKRESLPSSLKEIPKLSDSIHKQIKSLNSKTATSPVVLRKTYCDPKKQELRTAYNTEKLSSPFLVGQNVIKSESDKKSTSSWKKETAIKLWDNYEPANLSLPRNRSPSLAKRLLPTYNSSKRLDSLCNNNNQYRRKHNDDLDVEDQKSNSSVLRNPKRSEMTYFGVQMSPSPRSTRRLIETTETEHKLLKKESPIYENMESIQKSRGKVTKKEFDSSILDELTKAADQILQAVNGYAEEAEKQSLEEEKKNLWKKDKLDTISETKSWKQKTITKHSCKDIQTKPKLKNTSSTSSVESVSELKKPAVLHRRATESYKKKSGSDTSSSRAAVTKARRMQRASSREALLQSHGSSSEDLPVSIEVPLRKPRLVKKLKSSQTNESTLDESKHRKTLEKKKNEERTPIGALPTIRHRTAVSTIRSTAEKAQIRERNNRLKNEETKQRPTSRNETTKTSLTIKSDRTRNISSKEPINHRISTAYVPQYRRRKVEAKECPCLCS
ncbi:hypothetical protein FQR65_LT07469 [Abscondita terminalis]|nr:hypothetical protein FQR65_LT07469 [Abscondita terminalis]